MTGAVSQDALAHRAERHAADLSHLGFGLGKAALGSGDHRGGPELARGLYRGLHSDAVVAGLVHEQLRLRLYGAVKHLDVVVLKLHGGYLSPPGLLRRRLGDAGKALQLLFHAPSVRPRHAALAVEKHDARRPGLYALLHQEVRPLALRQPGVYRDLHARLAPAGDDLDDLGLGLLRPGAHQTAAVIRAASVADDDVLARAHPQHPDMLRVLAAYYRAPALYIRAGHEKPCHVSYLPKGPVFLIISHPAHLFKHGIICSRNIPSAYKGQHGFSGPRGPLAALSSLPGVSPAASSVLPASPYAPEKLRRTCQRGQMGAGKAAGRRWAAAHLVRERSRRTFEPLAGVLPFVR